MVKIITEAQASKKDDATTVHPFEMYGADQDPERVLLRLAAKTQPNAMSKQTKLLLNSLVMHHNEHGGLTLAYPKGYRACASYLSAVLNVRGRCNRIT